MEGIVLRWTGRAKARLVRDMRRCQEAPLKTRYLIVINLMDGTSPSTIAQRLKVARSTVYRVAARFREGGEAGLIDRREENGRRKLQPDILAELHAVVAASPAQHGWRRPTWTREMLRTTLCQRTGVSLHVSTMSRALRAIGARRGRPKPTVNCPWSAAAKTRRLRQIQRLVDQLPEQEVAVYEDEVDIPLNPKIGLDWMVPGQQKEVLTPGKNEKRYLAGALDVRSRRLVWVEGERKTSLLFLRLLWALVQRYPQAEVIHVILDNYSIHTTRQVELSLRTEQGQRLRLHFLPPYCPDHNLIERTWQDLHANVTRNHRCPEMDVLMREVRYYLKSRNKRQLPNTAA
jgi:transposase